MAIYTLLLTVVSYFTSFMVKINAFLHDNGLAGFFDNAWDDSDD